MRCSLLLTLGVILAQFEIRSTAAAQVASAHQRSEIAEVIPYRSRLLGRAVVVSFGITAPPAGFFTLL